MPTIKQLHDNMAAEFRMFGGGYSAGNDNHGYPKKQIRRNNTKGDVIGSVVYRDGDLHIEVKNPLK